MNTIINIFKFFSLTLLISVMSTSCGKDDNKDDNKEKPFDGTISGTLPDELIADNADSIYVYFDQINSPNMKIEAKNGYFEFTPPAPHDSLLSETYPSNYCSHKEALFSYLYLTTNTGISLEFNEEFKDGIRIYIYFIYSNMDVVVKGSEHTTRQHYSCDLNLKKGWNAVRYTHNGPGGATHEKSVDSIPANAKWISAGGA